jgi:hypothetical protein
MEKYRFYKEGNNWYVDLPSWQGAKSDLLMIGGADTMLDILSGNGTEVETIIARESFEGADKLQFIKPAEDIGEGAYYNLETHKGELINLSVFLCDVTLFVFNEFPKELFVKVA